MSNINAIIKNEEIRAEILKRLFAIKNLMPGSYKEVYRKCGRYNCWCANSKGHPLKRITWTEKGKSYSKAVKQENVKSVKTAIEQYKCFVGLIKALNDSDIKTRKLLDEYLKEQIEKTRMEKWKK